MKELRNGLITQKYTKVLEEDNYNFNAPHLFQVVKSENDELICEVHFQEGPIKECGVNGVCNEDLIAMVIRRLQSFQDSQFKCTENATAIVKLEESLMWLRKRTQDREARNVEGTHIV